ncbi:MAG TPA: flagellar protein FlaG, partial [Azoarcus taiwanensis]|nr:flagellar protein FlaG [Azoarcus taiwanensis]
APQACFGWERNMSISSIAPVVTPPMAASTGSSQGKPIQQGTGTAPNGAATNPADNAAQRAKAPNARPNTVPDLETLQSALTDVKAALSVVTSDLRFTIDDDTGRTVVKIVDKETDEVIKQIPSEEMLRISRALDTLQGLLIKQEV